MTTENIIINIRADGTRIVVRNLNDVADAADRAANRTDRLGGSTRSLATMFRQLAGALLINEFIKMADAATLIDVRLKMLIKSSKDLVQAQKDIYDIAQRNATGLRETAMLYSKIYEPVVRMGGGIKETTAIVAAFTASLRISGASTQEAAAATLQFGQAMSSGRAQGDEFRSMAENNPRSLKVFAEAMGVPIEKLKQMSSEGKMTSEVMGNAFVKSLDKLKAESAGLSDQLISGSFTRLYNDTILLVEAFNDLTGASSSTVDGIGGLSLLTKELSQVLKDELADGTKIITDEFDAMGIAIRVVGTFLEAFLILAADITFILKAIGRELGSIAAQFGALINGDFAAIGQIQQMVIADGEHAVTELERYQKRIASMTDKALAAREKLKNAQPGDTPTGDMVTLKAAFDEGAIIELKSKLAGINKSYIQDLATIDAALKNGKITQKEQVELLRELAKQTYEKSNAGKEHAKSLKDEANAYTSLLKSFNEKIAVEKLEAEGTTKLTSAEKMREKLKTDILNNDLKLVAIKGVSIAQQKESLLLKADEFVREEKANDVKKEAVKQYDDLLESGKDEIKSLDEQIKRQQEHNEQIGKSAAETENLRNKRMLDSAATDELTVAILRQFEAYTDGEPKLTAYIDQLERQVKQKRELAGLHSEGVKLEEGKVVSKELEDSQSYVNDMLDPTRVDRFSEALKQGIKGAAGAFVPLIKALDTYQAKQATLLKFQQENDKLVLAGKKSQEQATKEYTTKEVQYRLSSYGDMAGAAKGFFKENTEGYKTMATIEKIFRATELANTLFNFATKSSLISAFTGLFVASKATQAGAEEAWTMKSVAMSALRATADGVAGVAKAIASMPFPLNLAAGAATLAALMAIGVKMSGGVGGGSVDMSKQRQESAGTGSVLGDTFAKSESLTKSMELMSKNSQNQLSHTISMDNSLKTIASNIAGLADVVVKTGAIGDAAKGIKTGTSLGGSGTAGILIAGGLFGAVTLAIGKYVPIIGNLLNKLFGTTTSVLDQGITAVGRKLSDIQTQGISAMSYADVNTTKKFLGITYSNKTSQQASALPAEVTDQFTMAILSLADSIKIAAGTIGVKGAEFTDRLNNFVVEIGHISTKGMTGEQIQKQFETIFSKIGDDMTKATVGGLKDFAKIGEGAFQTLMRVATGFLVVNDALTSIGKKTFEMGMEGVKATESLIKMSGGLDKFVEQTNYFAENFLTDAERIAPIAQELHVRMDALGYGSVTTLEGFKNLVVGLDLTHSSQAALYVELLKLAPAFKAVADAAGTSVSKLDSAKQALDAAKLTYQVALKGVGEALETLAQKATAARLAEMSTQEKISAAYFAAQDNVAIAQQKIIDLNKQAAEAMRTFSTNIRTFIAGLSYSESGGAQAYSSLKASLSTTAVLAKGGDLTSQANLTNAAKQFLSASRAASPDSASYLRDEAMVRNLLTSVADSMDQQVKALSPAVTVDPIVAANAELIIAQNKLLDVANLAAATGASTDRSMTLVAGSTEALLAEFRSMHADNIKAQADYATATALTSGMQIPDMGSLNGFLTALGELGAAKNDLMKAQADMSAAIITTAQTTSTASADFVKSLNLTGGQAAILTKAMLDAKLSTEGYKALMTTTGLSAIDLATMLTSSGIAATDMAVILAKVGTDGETFASRLTLAGLDAASFAANLKLNGLKSDSLALIFDTSKAAADTLATALGSAATAAGTLADWLGTSSLSAKEIEKKFADVGLSTDKLNGMLAGTNFSAGDFFRLLSITGGNATSLTKLLNTEGFSASGITADKLMLSLGSTASTAAAFADLLKITGSGRTAEQLLTAIGGTSGTVKTLDDLLKVSGSTMTATQLLSSIGSTSSAADALKAVLKLTGTDATAEQLRAALGGTTTSAKSLDNLLKLTGGDAVTAAQLAGNIKNSQDSLQNFLSILSGSKTSVTDFNGLMNVTGVSANAILKVLGTDDKGLQGIAIASGKSLKDFSQAAKDANGTILGFDTLLRANGLTATSFDGLKALTGASTLELAGYLNAATLSGNGLALKLDASKGSLDALATSLFGTGGSGGLSNAALGFTNAMLSITTLLSEFKLPDMSSFIPQTKSLNQQLVEDWYAKNPNAIKNPSAAEIAYWIQDIERMGITLAKTAFANSVALTTGTIPIPIDQFSMGNKSMAPAPSKTNDETIALLKEIKAELVTQQDITKAGDLGNIEAAKKTTALLNDVVSGQIALTTTVVPA